MLPGEDSVNGSLITSRGNGTVSLLDRVMNLHKSHHEEMDMAHRGGTCLRDRAVNPH